MIYYIEFTKDIRSEKATMSTPLTPHPTLHYTDNPRMIYVDHTLLPPRRCKITIHNRRGLWITDGITIVRRRDECQNIHSSSVCLFRLLLLMYILNDTVYNSSLVI